MATTPAADRRISLVGSNRPRRSGHPARKKLVFAVVLVVIGSFLPWIYVAGVPKSGILGPGLWTFYAAMLGVAGVLLPFRRVGAGHAAAMAAAAVAVPVWQVGHIVNLVGLGGWMPGPGLVMVLGGGVLAAGAAWRMWREPVLAA